MRDASRSRDGEFASMAVVVVATSSTERFDRSIGMVIGDNNDR
jgi:hypothetical protein